MTLIRARQGGHGAEHQVPGDQCSDSDSDDTVYTETVTTVSVAEWRSWWRGWDDCKIVMTRRIRPGSSSGGGGEQFVSRHPATPLLTTPQQHPGLKIRLCLISGLG